MLSHTPAPPPRAALRVTDAVELFHMCASDRDNDDAWAEFLRRYTVKLKHFIHGTLRQMVGNRISASAGVQENDLYQNAIVRLVENNCAAMKRFSGSTEGELLAYLAVICRSAVLDTLRHHGALKRRAVAGDNEKAAGETGNPLRFVDHAEFEREILLREVMSLTRNTINAYSGDVSDRDHLVFRLHYMYGLSYGQIAQCKGINLSKAGVEKLLKRLVGRVQTLATSGKSEETLQ